MSAADSFIPPWDAMYREAVHFHQRGQLEQAAQRCHLVLQAQPQYHQALHLLGVIAAQQGRFGESVDHLARAIEVYANSPNYHINYGNALKALGRLDDALESYGKALQLQSTNAQAHAALGATLQGLGRVHEAIASYNQALALNPGSFEALFNRSVALQSQGQREAALVDLDRAAALVPGFAAVHFRRAVVLQELGRLQEAVSAYERVLDLQPEHAEACYNKGIALVELHRWDDAIRAYDRAIDLNPEFALAYCNRGVALQGKKQWVAALESFERAIALSPQLVEAHCNRGVCLHALQKWEEALGAYDQALLADSSSIMALTNRGVVLHACGRLDEAQECYERVLAVKPDYAEAQFYRSLILLLKGNFTDGWNAYQWLWRTKNGSARLRQFPQPEWVGQTLIPGQRVLIHSEQGLGDTIQFCRYAQLLAARGAYVILEVAGPLKRLLQHVDGVSELVIKGEQPLPAFDYQCLLLSLPRLFATDIGNIPSPTAYLQVDTRLVETWRERLGGGQRPRVGLVWSGSPEHMNDAHRSLPLSALLDALPDGFEYVSLQKELREGDRSVLDSSPAVRHFGEDLVDFAETAAICQLMDVIVSVDTSVAHLAASMGCPTWILLPSVPDWRWLQVREDSPWYESVRLFRQPLQGDWTTVLHAVGQSLQQFTRN